MRAKGTATLSASVQQFLGHCPSATAFRQNKERSYYVWPPIGIIASAASEKLVAERTSVSVPTPWGAADVLTCRVAGRDVTVVLRYGVGLTIPSHKINYGANVWALRALGVQRGVDMTEPFCSERPAEIRAFQRDGGDIVGTPLVPEGVFAREAELCFASIAPVINFGAGMAPAVVHFGPGSMNETYYADGLIERIIADAVAAIAAVRHCGCGQALRGGFHGQRPGWLTKCSLDEAGAGPGADA